VKKIKISIQVDLEHTGIPVNRHDFHKNQGREPDVTGRVL
jgi:hypothetical protein